MGLGCLNCVYAELKTWYRNRWKSQLKILQKGKKTEYLETNFFKPHFIKPRTHLNISSPNMAN